MGINWEKYTLDEDGEVRDRRDFDPSLTRFCEGCGQDLGHYRETGTLCKECNREEEADEG
jgi:hypothetical protein